eukprot:TRINITY_DN191_c0_g1_i6.p1 TRINITY_DN191_c0_g1~~TRINITY_DN191_c0_g1_i6.p1  ORF type:complete len:149 (-),score=18.82 TRINITY_DN191_c0_g1_i6:309-755(-)
MKNRIDDTPESKDGDPLYSSMRNATTITSVRSRSVTPIEDGSPLKFPPLKAAKISPTYTVAPSSLTFTHYRIADDVDPNHVNLRMTGSQSPCPSYAASTLNSTASSELSTRSRRPDNYFLSSQEIGRQMETKTPQLPDYWRNYPPIRR